MVTINLLNYPAWSKMNRQTMKQNGAPNRESHRTDKRIWRILLVSVRRYDKLE